MLGHEQGLGPGQRCGLVDEAPVAEEHDAVGPRGELSVVGDDHSRDPVTTSRGSKLITASPFTESSAPVGSSARRMWRSPTMARAMATRWRSPPERSSGNRPALSRTPRRSSASKPAGRARFGAVPSSSSGRVTFSRAVSPARRLKSWNTKPTVRRRSAARSLADAVARSWPSMSTWPPDGSSIAPAMVSSVLLPEPLGPITATSVPGATSRSMSTRASTRPAPSPYDLDTPRRSMGLIAGSRPAGAAARAQYAPWPPEAPPGLAGA